MDFICELTLKVSLSKCQYEALQETLVLRINISDSCLVEGCFLQITIHIPNPYLYFVFFDLGKGNIINICMLVEFSVLDGLQLHDVTALVQSLVSRRCDHYT